MKKIIFYLTAVLLILSSCNPLEEYLQGNGCNGYRVQKQCCIYPDGR